MNLLPETITVELGDNALEAIRAVVKGVVTLAGFLVIGVVMVLAGGLL